MQFAWAVERLVLSLLFQWSLEFRNFSAHESYQLDGFPKTKHLFEVIEPPIPNMKVICLLKHLSLETEAYVKVPPGLKEPPFIMIPIIILIIIDVSICPWYHIWILNASINLLANFQHILHRTRTETKVCSSHGWFIPQWMVDVGCTCPIRTNTYLTSAST